MNDTIKLELATKSHPFTGWSPRGKRLIDCTRFEDAIRHSAEYVRDNETDEVFRIVDNCRKIPVKKVEYVVPCMACGSLEHRTYSARCPKYADTAVGNLHE